MSLPATDNFDRADGPPGANWSDSVGSDLTISSNEVGGSAGGENAMYWSADAPNNDQYAQFVLKTYSFTYPGIGVRMSATDWVVHVVNDTGDNAHSIIWYNGGAYTQIASVTATYAVNDVIKITAVGTTFKGYQNGVEKISGSNGSAPASGYGGIRTWDGGARVDDFEVGNLSAGGRKFQKASVLGV